MFFSPSYRKIIFICWLLHSHSFIHVHRTFLSCIIYLLHHIFFFTLQYTFLLIESKHKSIIDHRINYENKQNNKIKWIENRKIFSTCTPIMDESFVVNSLCVYVYCSLLFFPFLSLYTLSHYIPGATEKRILSVKCDLYKIDFSYNLFFFLSFSFNFLLMITQHCIILTKIKLYGSE